MTTRRNASTIEAAIFARLEGEWRLERRMGDLGTFTGVAVFRPCAPDVLRYREDGVLLQENGISLPGYREYDYRLAPDGIAIHFADAHRRGALYVTLRFSGLAAAYEAQATHLCAPDTYRHRMIWHADDRFSTVVAVEGPRKSYTLASHYCRSATPSVCLAGIS